MCGIIMFTTWVDHSLRSAAQQNEGMYQAMLVIDGMTFMQNGGGALGYQNYFKWEYAKWINSPERTRWQKAAFWDTGIFYDASDPPEEYRYPPLY
ncbi:hypothetical protein ACFL14_00865 [Patescibacteria group bacterium]